MGDTGGNGTGNTRSTLNNAIKVLIKQETDKKVDNDMLEDLLRTKASSDLVHDLIERLNSLESLVHKLQ